MANLGERFRDALVYAMDAHAAQTRKGGDIPYIGHLLGVASIVIEAGGDEEQAIAALLHDAVEDQGGEARSREIEQRFGPRVRRIVEECSDQAPEGEERTAENWCHRKEAYLDHLREDETDARLVSLADKLYNARTILHDLERHGEAVWQRFHTPRDKQLWYYRSLAEVFRETMKEPEVGPLVKDLMEVVERIERHGEVGGG